MGRQGSWLWIQVVHHFVLAVDNYVLAETNHHDVERERRSGQSGHAEALELDIDEAYEPGATESSTKKETSRSAEDHLQPSGHDKLQPASLFPLYAGLL